MSKLAELVEELGGADRQERIELLIDLAKTLPALPERYEGLKDEAHRIPECQSPVYFFIEHDGDTVRVFGDAPIEAPTVRGFVAVLCEGLDGTSLQEALAIPDDILEKSGLTQILGMQRVSGLHAVVRRIKRMLKQLEPPVPGNTPR